MLLSEDAKLVPGSEPGCCSHVALAMTAERFQIGTCSTYKAGIVLKCRSCTDKAAKKLKGLRQVSSAVRPPVASAESS